MVISKKGPSRVHIWCSVSLLMTQTAGLNASSGSFLSGAVSFAGEKGYNMHFQPRKPAGSWAILLLRSALLRSHLQYYVQVWGPQHKKGMDLLQQATKMIRGLENLLMKTG